MSWALACAGWALVVVLLVQRRRRTELLADAQHELRGAATAIALAVERLPPTRYAALLRMQLDRMAAGLADLEAAREGRRRRASVPSRAGRLAQVLGNLVANAAEHGMGRVEVRSARSSDRTRVEIRNRNRPSALAKQTPERGRGLTIAARAARELGASLNVEARDGETVATVELPAGEAPAGAARARERPAGEPLEGEPTAGEAPAAEPRPGEVPSAARLGRERPAGEPPADASPASDFSRAA